MTDFKDMKEGPVKRLIERELRSFANDIEELSELAANFEESPRGPISPRSIRTVEQVRRHALTKSIVRSAMNVRGLKPKDGNA